MKKARRIIQELSQRAKFFVALGLIKSGLFRRNNTRDIWVFGGCSRRYFADNSAVLWHHVRKQMPDIEAYWVINRDSPDVVSAERVGKVLFAGELRTYLTILSASVHVISHGSGDIPGCDSQFARAFRVRLGHGLTALKKTKGSRFRPVLDRNRQFDLVPVASEIEKQNKLEWGFDESKLAITGIPRFDKLKNAATERTTKSSNSAVGSTIFYLPTWRSWLDRHRPQVRAEQFYDHVFGIFRDQRLLDFLDANDIRIRLCPHMGMRDDFLIQSRKLQLDRLSLVESYSELSAEIADCDLLITDYSSVAWDALYVGKPVMFYQFDRESFVKERGTHVDLDEDLFGPVCGTADELVSQITQHWNTEHFNQLWRPKMAAMAKKMFAFDDNRNCERIMAEILRRTKARQIKTQPKPTSETRRPVNGKALK